MSIETYCGRQGDLAATREEYCDAVKHAITDTETSKSLAELRASVITSHRADGEVVAEAWYVLFKEFDDEVQVFYRVHRDNLPVPLSAESVVGGT